MNCAHPFLCARAFLVCDLGRGSSSQRWERGCHMKGLFTLCVQKKSRQWRSSPRHFLRALPERGKCPSIFIMLGWQLALICQGVQGFWVKVAKHHEVVSCMWHPLLQQVTKAAGRDASKFSPCLPKAEGREVKFWLFPLPRLGMGKFWEMNCVLSLSSPSSCVPKSGSK